VTAVKDFSWKNKKVQVTFRISNDAEYSTISRVIDKVPHGNTPCLNIAHNNRLTRVQKRIYRRDNVDISVHIFALRIDVKKGKRKLVLANPKPFNGKITNISAGGLAIKAGGILKENSLVKLDFSMDLTNTDAAVGRVMTYSSIPNTNDKMLHIKFEKLSIKTRNRIFEYIYQGKKVDKKVFGPKTIIPPKSGLTITSVDENNN